MKKKKNNVDLDEATMGFMSAVIDSVFVFRMPKTVTIQVWQVGLVYRVCQLAVMGYLVVMLVLDSSWAYSEQPAGRTNAWASAGGYHDVVKLPDFSTLPYCADPAAYSFVYDDDFSYANPKCMKMDPWELFVKGNPLHITTTIVETRETGWPCGTDVTATLATAECAERGGEVLMEGGTQCICATSQTIYPVGVEKMVIAFEHQVGATEEDTRFDDVEGSSSTAEGEQGAITTTVKLANDTEFAVFKPGNAVRLSVEQWLKAPSPRVP